MIQPPNYLSLLKNALTQGIIIFGIVVVLFSPQLLTQLWTNSFSPLGDLVIYILMALIIMIIISIQFMPEIIFSAGLAAMIHMYHAPGFLFTAFLRLTTLAISNINKSHPILVQSSVKKIPFHLPLKNIPTSSLPYEHYGMSCILLS